MAAGRGDQKGTLGVVLPLDVDEVVLNFRKLPENLLEFERPRVHFDLHGERKPTASAGLPIGETLIPSIIAASWTLAEGTRRLVRRSGDSLQGHGEDALAGPALAGQGKHANDGEGA